ncbi:Protein S100-A6 Calcyclin S100 calcium-binding protein A6 [Channa argus]|uniref:Protein S100-A6 Calcyclin S100 calcium-binding protein A6 n=1 Tax=Channa argus TaxID=215402 RepID=A0A6G1PNS8_CHAAH|nr:Protein S100-A6 Calcyclin S100 calcium-binding protein A6 [Channa argus]
MSGLSEAVTILKATFEKYADKEGEKNTLTKRELAELLRNEFPVGGPTSKAAENNFFSMLDDDNNSVVNFMEFVNFVAYFATMSYQE